LTKTGEPLRRLDDPVDVYFKKDRNASAFQATVQEILTQNYNELDLNPLTHLPGIRSSVLCIERAIHSKKLFAVAAIDLSDLEIFNTAYGDARGDEVIIRLGEIIQEVIKKDGSRDDFLGHLGGDDFVVVTNSDFVVPISKGVIKAFDEAIPNFYDAHDRQQGFLLQRNKEGLITRYPIMSVSIAIAENGLFPITELQDISRITGDLQKKMKSLPGSCFMKDRGHSFNVEELDDSQGIHLPGKTKAIKIAGINTEEDKYAAFVDTVLKGKKIRTVYQPIVDLKSKKIWGYEALTRGMPGSPFGDPALLFGMARECGRLQELDKICLDFALRTGQGMPPDKKLFVNLNHETLIDPKSMKDLFAEKGAIGFKNIVIEVTEESILRSFEKVRDSLLELKEQGASVAIDDVGGGAVSLRDVAVLKPDYIKIDRSLVRQIDTNPTKQQIVLSMLLFANGIRATTTAEGIETKEEFDTLIMLGINLAQGFYLAKPEFPFRLVI
jgi:EAL domain-containing protein (putative c-di-GMP-specific phosphodiesterase class I)/GGDEF domain-containing protein